MLAPVENVATAIEALGPFQQGQFTFRNFVQRPATLLFRSSDDPGALLALDDSDLMLLAASQDAELAVMRDVYSGKFAPGSPWPNDATRRAWERSGAPYVFCNSSPLSVYEAGLQVGFIVPRDFQGGHSANLYWFAGQPRYSQHIRHSCRLGRGLELLEQLRSGVAYDEHGYYTRQILSEKPSFVCEVAGRPVSWSTIHLNGTMGMIYTPPEHRRQGYARSLACFQIDHELRARGFAACHVNSENVASYTMLLELGATREDTPIGWRMLRWPDGSCPYSV